MKSGGLGQHSIIVRELGAGAAPRHNRGGVNFEHVLNIKCVSAFVCGPRLPVMNGLISLV